MTVKGYDGKAIAGWQGVFIALREKFEQKAPGVTKEMFFQLQKDLEAFREKHASAGFMDKNPIEGTSKQLGFPPISNSEAMALNTKIKLLSL